MPKKNLERWMAKNDRSSYDFWKRILRPVLGRSLKRTDYAINLLKGAKGCLCTEFKAVRKAKAKISQEMQRYETMLGAQITFDFLRQLAIDHRRKVLRRRAVR